MMGDHGLRLLDVAGELEQELERIFPVRGIEPVLQMAMFLVRRHLEGRIVTTTTLAAAARIPYATAIRRIEAMENDGLILRRARTRTGRSFSLHPSPKLIRAWCEYARRLERIAARAAEADDGETDSREYFFGRSYMRSRAITPPAVAALPASIRQPLRMLIHADPSFMAMDHLKRQFEQVMGIAISNVALSIDRLRLEALRSADLAEARYDLIAVDLPWIGEFATRGVLRSLDHWIDRDGIDATDFYAAAWQGARYGGRQYAIPIQATPELFFYRRDLFAEYGIDPPRTTDDVLRAAARLHQPHRGLYGVAWNAARGTPLGHSFLMMLAAFGQPLIRFRALADGFEPDLRTGETLRPMIDTPAGLQVVDYMRALLAVSPPNIWSMSWYERIRSYSQGQVGMAYGYTLLAPYFEHSEDCPAHNHTGLLPHPSGPRAAPIAPVGGYVLGIPKNLAEDRKEAAWQALRFVTSPEAAKLYVLNGSLVTSRISVTTDPEVQRMSPLIGEVDTMNRDGLLQYWPRPPIPEISAITTICGEELYAMLRGRASPEEALARAQARADQAMRDGHTPRPHHQTRS